MFLEWSHAARNDILDILAYFVSLAEEETGKNIVSRILAASDILLSFPLAGRIGRIDATREMVVRNLPYILVYQAVNDTVTILRVFHTAKLFPEDLAAE